MNLAKAVPFPRLRSFDLSRVEADMLLKLRAGPAYPLRLEGCATGFRRRGDRENLNDRVLARLIGMRLAALEQEDQVAVTLTEAGRRFATELRVKERLNRSHLRIAS